MNGRCLEFDVHVRPGARRTEIGGSHDGVLAIKVTAPPADGRANTAICAALAAQFDVRPSAIELVRGASSRRKRIKVIGDPERLAARLAELIESRAGGADRPT